MSSSDVAPLNCNELVEIVTDYLEGSLSPADHVRFDTHISGCRGCHAYLEQMRRTIALTGKLTEAALTDAARDDLLQLFRDWKRDT